MITPESYKLISNHLHGCKLSRDFATDGEYTALTFTSIFNLRIKCDPRVRRGIPKGGSRPLVAIANAIKPRIEVFKSLNTYAKTPIYECDIKLHLHI